MAELTEEPKTEPIAKLEVVITIGQYRRTISLKEAWELQAFLNANLPKQNADQTSPAPK